MKLLTMAYTDVAPSPIRAHDKCLTIASILCALSGLGHTDLLREKPSHQHVVTVGPSLVLRSTLALDKVS